MSSSIVPHQPDSHNFQNFKFDETPIRIVERDGEPWFVAADVCAALGIAVTQTRRLDDDEKGLHSMQTPGGIQEISIINESGLYSLVLTSRKEEAKRFKKWVTSEVLPAIRKTGGYQARELTPLEILKQHIAVVEAQQAQIADHESRLTTIEAHQDTALLQSEHFTILAYCRLRHISITLTEAAAFGKRCTTMSNNLSIPVGKITDPRYGMVNTYHRSVLEEVIKLPKGGK